MKDLFPSLAFFKRFGRDQAGMTLPLLGASLFVLAGFAGVATDVARQQLVQARLSYALDAAGLAAGTTVSTTNLTAEATKYLNANFPAGYMEATAPSLSATTSNNNMVINLTASTTMPTTFMGIFGINQLTVTATSQITRATSGLELVMVLDNTGSMASSGKLTALKSAATSLVNILFGTSESVPKLWIGLVPFSQAVNIGTTYTSWMDTSYTSSLNWGPTSWAGCVDAHEANGRDTTDDPPSVEKFKPYYAPSTDNRPYPYNSYTYLNINKWVTQRDYFGNPTQYASGIGSTLGPNAYCPQKLLPMTANKTTILTAVNSMQALGNTHIDLGLGWGWRMLSPRWRGLWGGDMDANGLPLDYGTKHMNKAAIILTDGANTMDNYYYTGYGFLSDGRLGTTNSSTAVTQLNTRMTNLCTSMKEKGIYVYTIALGNPGTSIQNLMKSCATNENYYFNSPSASELEQIFNAIADSLSNLRVSK